MLALMTALFGEAGSNLIGIEEPENHVHPTALKGFAEYLLKAKDRVQILVTTHSPLLLDFLDKPEAVYVVRHTDQAGTLVSRESNAQAVRKALEESGFSLGEFYQTKGFGGRRNEQTRDCHCEGETERRSLPHLLAHLQRDDIAVVDVRVAGRQLDVETARKLVVSAWYAPPEYIAPDKFVILVDADGKDQRKCYALTRATPKSGRTEDHYCSSVRMCPGASRGLVFRRCQWPEGLPRTRPGKR